MSRRKRLAIVSCSTLLLLAAGALLLSANSGHRSTPCPDGLVFQLVVPEMPSPLEQFVVEVDGLNPPSIAIQAPTFLTTDCGGGGRIHTSSWVGRTRETYRYPSGEHLRSEPANANREAATPRPFDFDGDGTVDMVRVANCFEPKNFVDVSPTWYRTDECGLVQVLSGKDGSVLFEDRDDLEYENPQRAFPLGDIDGDGFGELVLIHPRADRSAYDIELWDALLGAHSWVSVVSGARVARR